MVDKDTKKGRIKDEGVKPPEGKRTRRSSAMPSKRELADKVAAYQIADQAPKMTAEQFEKISEGLFQVVEGLVNLPLTQVDPMIKSGWNEAAVLCANTYGATATKWYPLITLCAFTLFVLQDAVSKKKIAMQKKKGEDVPKFKQEDVEKGNGGKP